ncbi:MAG: recombinase family protein [Actinomycetota bacterium]|nr:recombinase family protein [Actinomycetota bacterium]
MGDEIPVGQLIGYARVSTAGQDVALQRDALERAGCARVYADTGSGSIRHRPELDSCLDYLRVGDTLVVWRLDRLGRSLKNLIETVKELERREVGFRSLTEGLDTTTAAGRLTMHIFAALAEFERALVVERTRAGLEAARARGRVGGRPMVMSAEKVAAARALRDAGELTMKEIASLLGVSPATLYRRLSVKEPATAGH